MSPAPSEARGHQIGALMAFAEQHSRRIPFVMDATYKARLARGIRLELQRGTNPADVKWAIAALLDRQLSPGLLRRKVEDRLGGPVSTTVPFDPYADFPDYDQEP